MVITFSHMVNNIVHLNQRDIHTLEVIRKIKVDLNGLDQIDFDSPLMPDVIRQAKEVKIRFHDRGIWIDTPNIFRRKCINCGKGSNTTYCKECWSEIG